MTSAISDCKCDKSWDSWRTERVLLSHIHKDEEPLRFRGGKESDHHNVLLPAAAHGVRRGDRQLCGGEAWNAAADEYQKTKLERSRTLARQFISIKCCVCIYSHLVNLPELQQGGVLSRSVTWKHPGLFSPVRSLFVVTAKVIQFPWHAATTPHKSVH